MTSVNINGIRFHAADGEPSDFECFTEGAPKATDTAPWGMIQEMKAFIRIQDERNLRNFVDVGALFGVFSLVFTRYKDAKALALEPSYKAFEGLLQNCYVNPDRLIIPLQVFAGDNPDKPVSCGLEWKHLIANRNGDDGSMPMTCKQYRLDDMIDARDCDCIKIDVEGYECPVLRGATELIKRRRPVIFLEAHFSVLKEVSGDSNESLFELINSLGYTPFTYQGEKVESFEGVNGHRYILEPQP